MFVCFFPLVVPRSGQRFHGECKKNKQKQKTKQTNKNNIKFKNIFKLTRP